MKKILSLLTAVTLVSTSSSVLISCNFTSKMQTISKNQKRKSQSDLLTSDWYKNIKLQKNNKIAVAYKGYYLNNNQNNSNNGWINNSNNQYYYIYLPNINNIDQAIKHVKMIDSARLEKEYGFKDDSIYWIKKGNTYTNTPYITQDTAVGGYSTISNQKQDLILHSNILKNLPSKEIQKYLSCGSIRPKKYTNSWWNSNRWESIFQKQNIQKVSILQNQIANYKIWSNVNNYLGMNISLSYISENSIVFSKTQYKYLYRLEVNINQPWINNSDKLIYLKNTPHWGLNFKVNYQNTTFNSDQIVTSINESSHYNSINKYLSQTNIHNFNYDKKNYIKVL